MTDHNLRPARDVSEREMRIRLAQEFEKRAESHRKCGFDDLADEYEAKARRQRIAAAGLDGGAK